MDATGENSTHIDSSQISLVYETCKDNWLGPLSTFSAYPINIDKILYPNAEHAIQCLRMKIIGHSEQCALLHKKKTPHECRRLGDTYFEKNCTHSEQLIWRNGKELETLVRVFWLRVIQNSAVREYLLSTADSPLICFTMNNPRWFLESSIHTYIREQIREIDAQN